MKNQTWNSNLPLLAAAASIRSHCVVADGALANPAVTQNVDFKFDLVSAGPLLDVALSAMRAIVRSTKPVATGKLVLSDPLAAVEEMAVLMDAVQSEG